MNLTHIDAVIIRRPKLKNIQNHAVFIRNKHTVDVSATQLSFVLQLKPFPAIVVSTTPRQQLVNLLKTSRAAAFIEKKEGISTTQNRFIFVLSISISRFFFFLRAINKAVR